MPFWLQRSLLRRLITFYVVFKPDYALFSCSLIWEMCWSDVTQNVVEMMWRHRKCSTMHLHEKQRGCFVSRGRCQVTLRSLTRYPWARCWTPNIHMLPWDELGTHPGVDPAGIDSDTHKGIQLHYTTFFFFLQEKRTDVTLPQFSL